MVSSNAGYLEGALYHLILEEGSWFGIDKSGLVFGFFLSTASPSFALTPYPWRTFATQVLDA